MVASFGSMEEATAALRAAYPSRPLPTDIAAFAALIKGASKRCRSVGEEGGPCARQVFVSHILGQLATDGYTVDVAAAKAKLVESHRAGLLSMSRCDLAEAFDAKDQADSEIEYRIGNHTAATWHFVRG